MRDSADRVKDNRFCGVFRKKKKVPKLPTNPRNCIDSLLDGNFQILNTAEKKKQM